MSYEGTNSTMFANRADGTTDFISVDHLENEYFCITVNDSQMVLTIDQLRDLKLTLSEMYLDGNDDE